MTELDKLEKYLKEKNISYERVDRGNVFITGPFDWGEQIVVYNNNGVRIWDVICGFGSYGHKQGLLELMIEDGSNDVYGHLTADQVVRKVQEWID